MYPPSVAFPSFRGRRTSRPRAQPQAEGRRRREQPPPQPWRRREQRWAQPPDAEGHPQPWRRREQPPQPQPWPSVAHQDLPQQGRNTIEVALRERPPLLGGAVMLAEGELLVEFVQQRNRAPYDLWDSVGGPSVSRL